MFGQMLLPYGDAIQDVGTINWQFNRKIGIGAALINGNGDLSFKGSGSICLHFRSYGVRQIDGQKTRFYVYDSYYLLYVTKQRLNYLDPFLLVPVQPFSDYWFQFPSHGLVLRGIGMGIPFTPGIITNMMAFNLGFSNILIHFFSC